MLGKKFDLIVSLGCNCGCASYLKKYNLRDYSYPYDWLYGSTFEKKVDLIVNDFDGFLVKENLRHFFHKGEEVKSHYSHYEDMDTGLCSIHDFPADLSLDESYGEVHAKYQRRIARLYEKGAQAREILFIWLCLNDAPSDESVLEAQAALSRKFKKDVNVLVLENDNSLGDVQEKRLHPCALKVKGPFDSGKGYLYSEYTPIDAVFSRINGRKQYGHVLFRILMRMCCWFVPSRHLRRKLRNIH